jgi:thiosulfate reductase cytochrome b subunit
MRVTGALVDVHALAVGVVLVTLLVTFVALTLETGRRLRRRNSHAVTILARALATIGLDFARIDRAGSG